MKDQKQKKLKVMTIFGTRPEIIRLSRIFAKLDKYTNHIMVNTGQSYDYEMSKIFFDELGVREPNYFLEVKDDTLGGRTWQQPSCKTACSLRQKHWLAAAQSRVFCIL